VAVRCAEKTLTVLFTFIDEGQRSIAKFERFLSDYRRRKRELACAERQQFRHAQFGHGRILRFLDHEVPIVAVRPQPCPCAIKLPSGEPGKEEAFISCTSTLKETRSTQRPTKGVIMRSDRIHKAAGKDKGYLALNE
jgi:hypothetical protein